MRYLTKIALISVCAVFAVANSAWAGVYNNSGTTAEDSICFVGINISADGRRALSVTAASDSLYVLVFYPGGTLAFRDSCLMNDAKITIAAFEDQAAVSGFSYKNSVAAVDGAGINGTYKVIWSIRDVDSANTTFGISEAQLFSTGADVSYSQALTDANSLTFTVAGVVDANMTHYEGQTGVDAEIQSEVEDGVNAATDINTLITGVTVSAMNSGVIDSADFAADAKKMIAIRSDSGVVDVTGLGLSTLVTTDNIGINWADVSNPTSTVGLTNTTVGTVTTVTSSVGAEIAASEVNADVWTELFASTGGDSILNALDYTNNTKHVYRRLDIDSAMIPAIKAKTDQLAFSSVGGFAQVDVADWGDGGLTIQSNGGFPSVSVSATQANAIGVGDISATMLAQFGDTVTNRVTTSAILDQQSDSLRKALGDTLTAFIQEVLDTFGTQGWAATAAAACNGSGPVSCTLDVRNGAGGLGGVTVTINNTSNVEVYRDVVDANGFVYFNLDQSTTYRVLAGGLAGTVHDSLPYQTLVTTTDNHIRDTIPMTTTAIGSPSAANLKRVYDDLSDFLGTAIQGANVIAELLIPDSTVVPYDTSSGFSLGKNPVPYTTQSDANGRYQIDLIPNDYIRPQGSRYKISVYYERRMLYSVTINATGTATALVRELQ